MKDEFKIINSHTSAGMEALLTEHARKGYDVLSFNVPAVGEDRVHFYALLRLLKPSKALEAALEEELQPLALKLKENGEELPV